MILSSLHTESPGGTWQAAVQGQSDRTERLKNNCTVWLDVGEHTPSAWISPGCISSCRTRAQNVQDPREMGAFTLVCPSRALQQKGIPRDSWNLKMRLLQLESIPVSPPTQCSPETAAPRAPCRSLPPLPPPTLPVLPVIPQREAPGAPTHSVPSQDPALSSPVDELFLGFGSLAN